MRRATTTVGQPQSQAQGTLANLAEEREERVLELHRNALKCPAGAVAAEHEERDRLVIAEDLAGGKLQTAHKRSESGRTKRQFEGAVPSNRAKRARKFAYKSKMQ